MTKSEAEMQIESLADVFALATTGFDAFYADAKEANEKAASSGNFSTAASSGNCSKAASSGKESKAVSSGYQSKAVSSGEYSTAASSGNFSTAASSGNHSAAASSGYYSKAVSSGYQSKAASSGSYSTAASSGSYSTAASSGSYSTAASSGEYSKAASSGNHSAAASSGYYSTAASSGSYSTAASSGYYSKAASSGNHSAAASSGYYSKAVSSGNHSAAASSGSYSTAASSGSYSTAASSGEYSACAAVGDRAAVKGDLGNLIMASEYRDEKPVGGKADIIDGVKLRPNCWYIVENGEWVHVDFTDNVFAYVISDKKGVKKVRTEDGEILYIVTDDNGNSAHGETIKQAREDLIYKAVAKFDGELPESAKGVEWIGIYRQVTGACAAGVKNFVKSTGKDINKTYTATEIAEIIQGQYGAEKFNELINKTKE